ncbi:MAG: transposase, partial [Dehalococcoidia bacterium]|nr:transposase [Dehalococcoidia bacterium]
MTRGSIREQRYRGAKKGEKGRLLDEMVVVTGYHRKALVRLLSGRARTKVGGAGRGRPRLYGPQVARAAKVLWYASGEVSARRLQPFVPVLLERLKAFGELAWLEAETEALLCRASASSLERLLAPARLIKRGRGLSTTRSASFLKKQIAVRTFADWDDVRPGFLEVDLVAH